MSTRVTFSQITTNVQNEINKNYVRLDKLQTSLASGKRIMRPSDDPVAILSSLAIRSDISQIGQFKRNIDDGKALMATIDSTLMTQNNLFQAAREKAIYGANDTQGAEQRIYIGREVRVMLDQMVAMANTSFKGDFIFAGGNTQVAPYELKPGSQTLTTELTVATVGTPIQIWDTSVTDSNTPSGFARAYHIIPGSFEVAGFVEGTDYTVDYVNGRITFTPPGTDALTQAGGAGIDLSYEWIRRNELDLDAKLHREVDKGITMQINTTASDVYGGVNDQTTWEAMITLLDGLHNNQSTKMLESIGKLETGFNRSLGAQATNGARMNRLDYTDERNTTRTVDMTRLKSQLEDVDFAEAISQFLLQQSVYDASLRTGARAIQNTLANFL